jgi:hypothetical protein
MFSWRRMTSWGSERLVGEGRIGLLLHYLFIYVGLLTGR